MTDKNLRIKKIDRIIKTKIISTCLKYCFWQRQARKLFLTRYFFRTRGKVRKLEQVDDNKLNYTMIYFMQCMH